MRISKFASVIAIALFSTGVMAQSGSGTTQTGSAGQMNSESSQTQNRDPDMQADTIEGQSQGATAQYEMGGQDGQTSDDVEETEAGSTSSSDELDSGTKQDDDMSTTSSGAEH